MKPALDAIDDTYAEIADFIAKKVLPLYGKAILPDLKSRFDLKSSKGGHLRRLALMHQLDPDGNSRDRQAGARERLEGDQDCRDGMPG